VEVPVDKPRKTASPHYIHWHPAFVQALQAEFFDFKDALEFRPEFQLSSEPLRIDALIIVKAPNIFINKNIARIFKTHNIWEFKSPGDSFSIKDFFKVYAYAALYAALTPEADLADITLSFVGTRYPRKLIKYLTGVRKYRVEEVERGIYQVRGDYLPIQLIETKKLSRSSNQWLKELARDLEREEMRSMIEEGERWKSKTPLGAYLDALIHANSMVMKELITMSKRRETLEDVLTELGLIPKWVAQGEEKGMAIGLEQGLEQGREQGREQGLEQGREQGALQIARRLLKKGWSIEEVAETTELDIGKVRGLTASRKGRRAAVKAPAKACKG
jgi:hypothetical protein